MATSNLLKALPCRYVPSSNVSRLRKGEGVLSLKCVKSRLWMALYCTARSESSSLYFSAFKRSYKNNKGLQTLLSFQKFLKKSFKCICSNYK